MNVILACVLAAAIAFAISFGLGYVVIPFLHKLKFGQTILDIGPKWHKNKQGTPTMGGILFIAGTLIAFVAVVVSSVRNGKNGKCPGGCGGSCGSCQGCGEKK